MPEKKTVPVLTYEVGVKSRKPYIVRADKFNAAYEGDLRFHLGGQCVLMVHRQKWDFVRLVPDENATP